MTPSKICSARPSNLAPNACSTRATRDANSRRRRHACPDTASWSRRTEARHHAQRDPNEQSGLQAFAQRQQETRQHQLSTSGDSPGQNTDKYSLIRVDSPMRDPGPWNEKMSEGVSDKKSVSRDAGPAAGHRREGAIAAPAHPAGIAFGIGSRRSAAAAQARREEWRKIGRRRRQTD